MPLSNGIIFFEKMNVLGVELLYGFRTHIWLEARRGTKRCSQLFVFITLWMHSNKVLWRIVYLVGITKWWNVLVKYQMHSTIQQSWSTIKWIFFLPHLKHCNVECYVVHLYLNSFCQHDTRTSDLLSFTETERGIVNGSKAGYRSPYSWKWTTNWVNVDMSYL